MLNDEKIANYLIENYNSEILDKSRTLINGIKPKRTFYSFMPSQKDLYNYRRKSMIKYIYFDWGYTLISSFKPTDDETEQIVKKYGYNWKEFFKIWRNYHYLHSLGRIKSKEEKYEQISKLTGVPVFELEKIGDILLESHILDEKTKETLIYLKNKGYRLGIISNNIDEDVRYILNREKILDLFDKVVCSSSVGERKPSANIFLEAYGDIPKNEYENILFVSDELAEDIIGSKALGTKNAWITKNTVNAWRKEEKEIFSVDYKIQEVAELKYIL